MDRTKVISFFRWNGCLDLKRSYIQVYFITFNFIKTFEISQICTNIYFSTHDDTFFAKNFTRKADFSNRVNVLVIYFDCATQNNFYKGRNNARLDVSAI